MIIGIDARQLAKSQTAGIGTYVDNIVKYLSENDNENTYILYSHKPLADESSLPGNFKVRIIPNKVGSILMFFLLSSYLKEDSVDVFWGPEHILPPRIKGLKYVLTIHDTALLINKKWGAIYNVIIQNTLLKVSARRADIIIAVSFSTKKDIIQYLKINPATIKVVHNGGSKKGDSTVHSDFLNDSWTKNLTHRRFFFYLGTIEPRKNIGTIIKAFEKVKKEYRDIKLVLAGKLGWNYDGILETYEKSICKEDIIMPGFISASEKDFLYHHSCAFIFPSHYEGFGIPIIEAMSNECVVITSRNSSLQEVGGNAALYVNDENDSDKLALMMKRTLEMSSNDRNAHITKGLAQASLFTWESCAGKTMEIIHGGTQNV